MWCNIVLSVPHNLLATILEENIKYANCSRQLEIDLCTILKELSVMIFTAKSSKLRVHNMATYRAGIFSPLNNAHFMCGC